MSRFDHGEELPPELSDVAHELRSHRYEASALELDAARTRILKRTGGPRAPRGGFMRKRSLLTAVIMFGAIGSGAAGALAVGGHPINFASIFRATAPRVTAPRAVAPAPHASAALVQYGPEETTMFVICRARGGTGTCTAYVRGIDRTPPTGTVSFTATGFGPQTCTLSPGPASYGPITSSCSVTYSSTTRFPTIHFVTASYSGDALYMPNTARTILVL